MLRLVRSLTDPFTGLSQGNKLAFSIIQFVPSIIHILYYMADEQPQDLTKPISYGVEKLQLRGVQKDIDALQNRLKLLREQQRQQKSHIQSNKQRLKKAVQKKKDIHGVLLLKERDRSLDNQRLKDLSDNNRQKRQQHKQMMEDLMQACYLVKSDQAREIKTKSIEHEEAMRHIKEEMYQSKRSRQEMIKEMKDKGRKEYIQYWNGRVKETIETNQKGAQEALTMRQQKQRYLKELEKEEIKLLKEIYRTHEQAVDSKKDYITALSVPAEEIASLYPAQSPKKPAPTPTSLPEPPPKPKDKKVEEYLQNKKLPKAIELDSAKLRKVMQALREQRARSSTQRALNG